jgi:hypothetical protein
VTARTVITVVVMFWAGLVLGRAAANGFDFNDGSYGAGQKFAVVLAVVVAIVGAREMLKARSRRLS